MFLSALRLSRFYRIAAWLALWVMLLPLALPLLHPMATVSDGSMPMCHMAMGDAATGDNEHQKTPDQDKSKPFCPLCQGISSLAHGYVPSAPADPTVLSSFSTDIIIHHQDVVVHEVATASWPHAPPSLV